MECCTVFYEGWQMECCGKAFETGGNVKWLVLPCGRLNTPVDVGQVDYCYEAHCSDWTSLQVLEGRVEAIQILYHRYVAFGNRPKLLKPIEGTLVPADSVGGFEESIDGMEASGYLVKLSSCSLRRAREEEVTFP